MPIARADYSHSELVLTDFQRAWAITVDSTRELTADELASLQIPRRTTSIAYQPFDDFQGRRGITISVPPGYVRTLWDQYEPQYLATLAFYVASHELFHFTVQDLAHGGWSIPLGTKPAVRGIHYPLDTMPRIARLELSDALVAAYAEPPRRAEHLGAAAYWYTLWVNESGEAGQRSTTDQTEGTAEYFAAVTRRLNRCWFA